MVAQYAGDTNYEASPGPGLAIITVTGTDFALAVNPPSLTVPAPGQAVTANVYVNGQSNYTGYDQLQSCIVLKITGRVHLLLLATLHHRHRCHDAYDPNHRTARIGERLDSAIKTYA